MSTLGIGSRGIGWFGRLFGFLKRSKDPVTKSIYEAIAVLDKMINSIESTKKSLESVHEDHSRRAKLFASEGRKQYENIFIEELKHIAGLISMFDKVQYDLMRVRYRLETLTLVEEPIRLLPEVIQELQSLKPEVEKIAPELSTMLMEVERKVTSIIASSDISNIAGAVGYKDNTQQVDNKNTREKLPVPPLPPEDQPEPSPVQEYNLVPLAIVKKWILDEIRTSGGVFVVRDFTKKYKVPKHLVYDALRKLEEEGHIRLRH
ncbi:Snf7 family protein [Staphylothermus hellenicus]|uniref:Uncharacterized protein n=1 Tax=Staphylothermus hellenicus (strain DSM 12710 / JCM 10830 / BK20S6-10-b1 / P8) TaxID=591019 RepID=D7D928_STAHD|nr:hypothetical protein [Staphylothermus hellenicus]ADI32274.1 hypothetical protein Shell_1174 [Staphylothermus hellenicus DSM 12710]